MLRVARRYPSCTHTYGSCDAMPDTMLGCHPLSLSTPPLLALLLHLNDDCCLVSANVLTLSCALIPFMWQELLGEQS